MPIDVEQFESSALSAGNCGANTLVNISGKRVIVQNIPTGEILSTNYRFFIEHITTEGCFRLGGREGSLPAGSPGRCTNHYSPYGDPRITDLGNGIQKKEYYIRLDFFLQDYCGICYNPETLGGTRYTESATSQNPDEVAAAQLGFFRLYNLLIGLPKPKGGGARNGGRLSIPEGRRLADQIHQIFNIPAGHARPDPCGSDVQSRCDLTP